MTALIQKEELPATMVSPIVKYLYSHLVDPPMFWLIIWSSYIILNATDTEWTVSGPKKYSQMFIN